MGGLHSSSPPPSPYQSEYERNVVNTTPNVGIFITKDQKDKVKQLRDVLAKEIEAKRDPNVIYKFGAGAYITTYVRAHFVDGKPANAYFGDTNLGSFTLTRMHPSDFEYVIDRQTDFTNCRNEIKTFYLEVFYSHDGCVGGWFARVFDSQMGGRELVDLTDIDLNSQ